MATELRGLGPLYIETKRDKRLEIFHRLQLWFNERRDESENVTGSKDEFGRDRYPYLTLEPWYEDPEPPWPRRPFTIPLNEIFYNTELQYASLLEIIKKRAPYCYQTFDGKAPVSEELAKASKEWEKRHPGLEEQLKGEAAPGLEGVEGEGMKFLVWRTAAVGSEVLERFLESCKQADPRDESFKVFEPFSYLFVDGIFPSLEEYKGGATHGSDLGPHFPLSRFIGRSIGDVVQAFEELVAPVKDRRSLYGTRCFIVLDEQTVKDDNTAEIVTIEYEGWSKRRVAFAALKKGLLKALEMVMLDLDMLEVDEGGVVGEHAYGPDAS